MADIQELFAPKAGDRYIVLSDKEQEIPKRVKVYDYNIKESGSGKQYVELAMIDENDAKLKVSVFQRDVKMCVQQWGTNPKDWGYIQFVMNMTGGRYYLAPHPDQIEGEL